MATKMREAGKEKGLAGAVRAIVMARKTAMASNKDDNHVDGDDSKKE
jgi:hypothetical protein